MACPVSVSGHHSGLSTSTIDATPSTIKFDTALFDFDGTIMDTNDIVIESWQYTVRMLTGREVTLDELRTALGEVFAFSMKRIMPEIDFQLAVETYRTYQREKFLNGIHLFDGVTETLAALQELGIKIGLVTSRLANSTYKALDHFDIRKYFDIVLTEEDCSKFKPDPEPLLLALARLESEAAKTIYLGDAIYDILAAKRAGVCAVLADWSVALPPGKRAGSPKPDLIIEHMRDLLKLFK
ncbi:haloacid dehalogenase [Clostridia bacterium]|nr:haloacid dehalogenase [Clostridia bacterium]